MNATIPQNPLAEKGIVSRVVLNTDGLYKGDLKHYFRIIFFKARNVQNPYHNFRHMIHVMCSFFEACEYYLLKQGIPLTFREVRNGLIAALFHDFDHSGRTGHDDLEIERAIRGCSKHILDEDRADLEAITSLIRITQYPYIEPSAELTLTQQILRDADMSQAMSPVWMQQIGFGLAAEVGIPPMEMLRGQLGFLRSLKFCTEWGQQRFTPELMAKQIQQVQELIAILE